MHGFSTKASKHMRNYPSVRALENGHVLDLGGIFVIRVENPHIEPGDLYVAERNTGPHFLTCRELGDNCIHPTSIDYSFDTWECVKVREATQEEVAAHEVWRDGKFQYDMRRKDTP